MRLPALQTKWEWLGRRDPMWAILTDNEKRGNKWEKAEFFATGRSDVQHLMRTVAASGLHPQRARALDFGCGIGRLTQALAEHFETVLGVDIAPSMIEQARQHNEYGERCEYLLNAGSDLSSLGSSSFDLVYSQIVLQHIPPQYSIRYIAEFVRLLRPGGALVFQVPARTLRRRLRFALLSTFPTTAAILHRLRRGSPQIDMFTIPEKTVTEVLWRSGATVVRIEDDGASGDDFESKTYYATR